MPLASYYCFLVEGTGETGKGKEGREERGEEGGREGGGETVKGKGTGWVGLVCERTRCPVSDSLCAMRSLPSNFSVRLRLLIDRKPTDNGGVNN